MTLAFLTPSRAPGSPVAESPMTTVAERRGGRCEVRHGWRVPVAFDDVAPARAAATKAVAFADASWLGKLQVEGPADRMAAVPGGMTLGTATAHEGAWWCSLTPTRALVVGAAPDPASLAGLHAVDVTAQQCALRIEGPLTGQLMARFCALDLRHAVAPAGTLLPGSVARMPGLVLVEAVDRLLVLVGAAYAEYFWTVVEDAARRLGGRPVGVDVIGAGPLGRQEATTGA